MTLQELIKKEKLRAELQELERKSEKRQREVNVEHLSDPAPPLARLVVLQKEAIATDKADAQRKSDEEARRTGKLSFIRSDDGRF